jgi:hypothetical protein
VYPPHAQACVELDILEANNFAMQTSVRTQKEGSAGGGDCDANGCYTRLGGPTAPPDLQEAYGPGDTHTIDSFKPFDVVATVDDIGAMSITLAQGTSKVISFDQHMGGAQCSEVATAYSNIKQHQVERSIRAMIASGC